MMKFNWKKYLIITGIISILLALIIPETIEYVELNRVTHSTTRSSGIDINIYGLWGKLLSRTLSWFSISFYGFIFFGFIYSLFRSVKNNGESGN